MYESSAGRLLIGEVTHVDPTSVPVERAKILVVDDDPFMLKVIGRQLSDLGCQTVVTTTSGADAVAACTQNGSPPDLVLLDLNMPDMDGLEVLRLLGISKFAGDIVFLSGEDATTMRAAETLARAHQVRVLGTHVKPLTRETLSMLLGMRDNGVSRTAPRARRQFTAAEVATAISRGELFNYYQPKVLSDTGAVVGVEALVRWQHPEAGVVFPDQFIPVAEANGLIRDLTRCVIKSALARASAWHKEGLCLTVAINITMDDLASPEFPTMLIAMTRAANVPPDSIILEVTESQIVPDLLSVLDALTRLRLHRFRLSIDDFGTGHSSLAQLRDLPFDELKIDQTFARSAYNDERLGAFVRSTITLARNLGLTSVAEGVETAQDWSYLRSEGARCSQGYFIARPMAAEAIQGWISEWHGRVRSEGLCADPREAVTIDRN